MSKAGGTGIWTNVAITEQGKICDNSDIESLSSSPSVFSITAPGLRDLHENVGRFHVIETRLSQLASTHLFNGGPTAVIPRASSLSGMSTKW